MKLRYWWHGGDSSQLFVCICKHGERIRNYKMRFYCHRCGGTLLSKIVWKVLQFFWNWNYLHRQETGNCLRRFHHSTILQYSTKLAKGNDAYWLGALAVPSHTEPNDSPQFHDLMMIILSLSVTTLLHFYSIQPFQTSTYTSYSAFVCGWWRLLNGCRSHRASGEWWKL